MLRKVLIGIYLAIAVWYGAHWMRMPTSLPELEVRPVIPRAQGPSLSLLKERKYQELETQLSAFQKAYEQDVTKEEDLLAAFRIFYETDHKLEPYLEEWIAQEPLSYAANLARGIYYRKVGDETRGDRYIRDTSKQQLQGMERYLQQAMLDLRASLKLTPKPILSYLHLLDIGMTLGLGDMNQKLLDEALRIEPNDFIVRRKYMYALRPKWGGSFEQMDAFLDECKKSSLSESKLQTLEAVILLEKGIVRDGKSDHAGALVYFTQALMAEDGSDENTKAHEWKGAAHVKLEQFALAIPDCTVVLSREPDRVWSLQNRAYSYWKLGDEEKAFKDYLTMATLGNDRAQNELGTMYWYGKGTTQNKAEAMRWFQLAAKQGNKEAERNLQEALKQQ